MTIADIIKYVDKNSSISETDITKHVSAQCKDANQIKQLCMYGISRLAGHCQIRGDQDEWLRLINILKVHYY